MEQVTPQQWVELAGRNEVDTIRQLLGQGFDVNTANDADQTAIMLAAKNGSLEAIQVLLEAGADISLRDCIGWNALGYALYKGQKQAGEALRKVWQKPKDIFDAAALGDTVAIRSFLSEEVSPNAKDQQTYTPLMFAAMADHAPAVRLLLESGAKVDLSNSRRETPLKLAAVTGSAEAARVLLVAGADPNKSSSNHQTALVDAALVAYTLDTTEVVKQLIAHGASIGASDRLGRTALWWAVSSGHLGITKLLLDAGADVQNVFIRDRENNQTALDYALEYGGFEVIELIRDLTGTKEPKWSSWRRENR
jgi:ankyrin repeat protein